MPLARRLWAPRGVRLIFGARRTIFQYLKPGDVEAHQLLRVFLRALEAEEPAFDAAGRAARALLEWLERQNWDAAVTDQFKREITRRYKIATYGRAALDVRIGGAMKAVDDTDMEQAARVWGVLLPHLRSAPQRGAETAFKAFQRMQHVMGPLDEGWERLLAVFPRDKVAQIAEHADQLRAGLRELEGLPARSPKRAEVMARIKAAQGTHSRIKGMLGEIFLAKWPALRHELAARLDEARMAAARMGEGWEALHLTGNIHIDGLESYDQAVVLVNWKTRQTVLHTAVQMKVETGALSVFKQIERDLTREAGKVRKTAAAVQKPGAAAMRPPVGTFAVEGQMQSYSLVDPEPWMTTHRYVYFAEGGKVGPSHVKQLENLGVEAHVIPVDLPVDWLDALALEVMSAAKGM